MTMSFLKGSRLRQWINRPDCPAILKECKLLFDKAFGNDVSKADSDKPADSAYITTPAILRPLVKSPKVALRAQFNLNETAYCRSTTHVGNSLVMFYPKGDKSQEPIPGSIEHIIFEPNRKVTLTVRRQLPTLPGFVDPYVEWPHFPARVYSTSLSSQLEGVDPEWITSHYARWAFDKNHAVILNLSRVCACSDDVVLILNSHLAGLKFLLSLVACS